MQWHRSTIDPMLDAAAAHVIAAFDAAEKAGLCPADCYLAGVAVWRRAHPDQRPEYASAKAVDVMIKARIRLRIPGGGARPG